MQNVKTRKLRPGSYAEVRLAKEKTTDRLYAVKVINKAVLKRKLKGLGALSGGDLLADVKREVARNCAAAAVDSVHKTAQAIMKKLAHPHVLRLFEVMDDPRVNKLYLVLEHMQGGDLMRFLRDHRRRAQAEAPRGRTSHRWRRADIPLRCTFGACALARLSSSGLRPRVPPPSMYCPRRHQAAEPPCRRGWRH